MLRSRTITQHMLKSRQITIYTRVLSSTAEFDIASTRENKTSNILTPADNAMKFYKDGKLVNSKCGPIDDPKDAEDDDEMEEMFTKGPMGIEWNGPTRGKIFLHITLSLF